MPEEMPTILALDFDGVLCDGLIEYFQTAWRAYCQIWTSVGETPPEGLAEQFYRLRPVIETGWEMPLLIHALIQRTVESEILANWGAIVSQMVAAEGLAPKDVEATVDRIRDRWIENDPDNWLAQHRFYPGVITRLQDALSSDVHPFIITTKEERFVRQLLQQQGVELPESDIFGKAVRQPKAQTLRVLKQQWREQDKQPDIWFIEDRLKTLQGIVTQPDLDDVKLYLADWGYNTASEQGAARNDGRIHLLSLDQFAQDFPHWS